MPFGLCNAPATFQRLIDNVIEPQYRDFVESYIDDLMTHSSTFDDHMKHLDVVLGLLQKNNLMIKLSKCKFAQLTVKFLGHLISHRSLRPNPEAVESIRQWQRPKDGPNWKTAVRSFVGGIRNLFPTSLI